MAKVFISYSTLDHDFSELVKMKLNQAEVDVWMDQQELLPGEEWRKAIDRGIDESTLLIVVLTPNSTSSSYVTYEWAYAIGQGKNVIPLLRQDSEIHPRLEVFQYLDFRDSRSYPWSELVSRIGDVDSHSSDKNIKTSVGDLPVEKFQEIIESAVYLAAAQSKSEDDSMMEKHIPAASELVFKTVLHRFNADIRQNPKILWVDDMPENNELEQDALVGIGYEIKSVLNTEEALKELNQNSYAAVISDMGRKEGPREGYVLLERVRDVGNDVPFFIYAGSNQPEHKREAMERGAQGSTNSPSELFELIASVQS